MGKLLCTLYFYLWCDTISIFLGKFAGEYPILFSSILFFLKIFKSPSYMWNYLVHPIYYISTHIKISFIYGPIDKIHVYAREICYTLDVDAHNEEEREREGDL